QHQRVRLTTEEEKLLLDAINELEATGELSKRWDWFEEHVKDPFEEHIKNPIEEHILDPVQEKFEKWGDKLTEKWDKLKDKFGEKADKIREFIDDAGSFSKDERWDFDLNHDFSEKKLTWDMMESNELWCRECYSRGKFVIEGKIVMEKMDLKEA